MQLQDAYPIIVTDRLFDCRDFYVCHLGFVVGFAASWIVWLHNGGKAVAFMHPDHPSRPPGPERFSGLGAFLTLQVADATAEYRRLANAGVSFHHPLTDEPWGQRRFMLRDPVGALIDVVQMTEPKPGFWDAYPAPA